MATYLLTWNPRKSDWIDLAEDSEAVEQGYYPRFEWSCGNTKRIEIGDRVFMMRLGWRESITGIMASGQVTGEPLEGEHWSDPGKTTLYIEFELDALLIPGIHRLLDPATVSSEFNWYPQRSGVVIPNNVAEQLEHTWQQHLRGLYFPSAPHPEETESRTFKEGSLTVVSGYRYERNPHARAACINRYGTQCVVCKFDFGVYYGDIGKGFIHVHHLIPLSERDEEYELDPIRDLRPVCPNCHAMLHRKSPPYSITELQQIVNKVDRLSRQADCPSDV